MPKPDSRRLALLRSAVNEIRRLLLRQAPHLGPLLYKAPIAYRDTDEPAYIASTNGSRIQVGPRFFELPVTRDTPAGPFPADAPGVLLHEIFHVALGHPARFAGIRDRLTRPFSHETANIAADCIVNDLILDWSPVACSLPKGTVIGHSYLPMVVNALRDAGITEIPDALLRPTRKSSLEELHDALLEAFLAILEKLPSQRADSEDQDGNTSGNPSKAGSSGQPPPESDENDNPATASTSDDENAGDQPGRNAGQQDHPLTGADDQHQHDNPQQNDSQQQDGDPADSSQQSDRSATGDSKPAGTDGDHATSDDPGPATAEDAKTADDADLDANGQSPSGSQTENSTGQSGSRGTGDNSPEDDTSGPGTGTDSADPHGTPPHRAPGQPSRPDPHSIVPRDLLPQLLSPIQLPANLDETELSENADSWNRALQSAAQAPGSNPGNSILENLSPPSARYPWQKRLAPILTSALIPRPGYNNTTPSRNTLACAAAGHPAFAEPGISHASQGATLCVLLDSSGSMFMFNIIERLLGHVRTIAQRTGAQVHFIAGDTEIKHEQQDLDLDPAAFDNFHVPGGGGTILDPLFERAAMLQPHCILCMTDGYLFQWPRRPACMTIWVTAGESCLPGSDFPYGKHVNVP